MYTSSMLMFLFYFCYQDGRYVADCYSRILELNNHNIKAQVFLKTYNFLCDTSYFDFDTIKISGGTFLYRPKDIV